MSLVPEPLMRLPWRVYGLLTALALFGCIVLFSAAGGHIMPWAGMQAARFLVFCVMAESIARIPFSFVERLALPAYAAVLAALVLVELIGGVAGGSQRWINLGFMQLQPSEFMKLTCVLAVARFYTLLPARQVRSWTAIWPALALIGLPAALIMLQPDLGTALMVTAGGVTVMFMAGLPMRLFVGAATGMAAIVPIAFTMLHDYQKKRILIFMDPESDPLGAGYHI
ncbi:MAG: FtsW/RodA/SpoVE family cell cycle protein, partial [Sphingobium sp.]